MIKKQWFESWFDSPYYHTLYSHRDFEEAELFIKNLLSFLTPKENSTFLDLACGAGRHSKYINSFGYQVTGVDLSENSIKTANDYTNKSLDFFVHDMRNKLESKSFSYVFNLFTSFGYFENHNDNLKVLTAIKSYLEHSGTVVIDFMNANRVINNIVSAESITKQGVTFEIKRAVVNGIIIKNISFTDKGVDYHFEEKVQALQLKDFTELCNKAGFSIVKVFGNYALEEYNEEQSDRLIMVLVQKH